MSNLLVAFIAYLIDKIFGEFGFIKHPIITIGEMITWFEESYYKNSIFRGFLLVLYILSITGFVSGAITLFLAELPLFINVLFTSIFASIFIAHNMLLESVAALLNAENKKESIAMLVSRDTQEMSESDIYKAAIETYGENLSDGVIAPLFYLTLFGLPGIVLYKAVNTMDSMVGYRTSKYENYGKVAARLDDILNFIPSRLTAILIMLLGKKNPFAFYKDGKKHDSPNAGHPITAMALVLGLKLGGDTSYFGKIKHKATFGEGREIITKEDVKNALDLGKISLIK
jgi:adenosylcobinamide-phosphate synthase